MTAQLLARNYLLPILDTIPLLLSLPVNPNLTFSPPSRQPQNIQDEQQQLEERGLMAPPQSFDGSGDLLEILMSDFNSSWPVTLPVLPFPSFRGGFGDAEMSNSPTGQNSISAPSPGHQAMD